MSDTSTPQDIERRIREASDKSDQTIHSVTKVGSDDVRDYYLVVAESDHNGRAMFSVRYFAAGTVAGSEDTWMKNGLTARYTQGAMDALGRGLIAAENRKGNGDDHDVLYEDVTGDGAE